MILAMDTSTAHCTVAFAERSAGVVAPTGHAEHLADLIRRIVPDMGEAQILAVAGKVGEGERRFVEHTQKSALPAAVLDVGPAAFADAGHVETVPLRDEGGFGRPDQVVAVGAALAGGVGLAAAVRRLLGAHGGREHEVGVAVSHCGHSG